MVALSCPSLTCGYFTGEVAEFKDAMRLLETHVDMDHAAENVNTIDEAMEEGVAHEESGPGVSARGLLGPGGAIGNAGCSCLSRF